MWPSQRQGASSWLLAECFPNVLLDLLPVMKGSDYSVCLHSLLGWLFVGEDPVTKIHTHIHTVHHQPALSSSGKRNQRKKTTYMNVDAREGEDKRDTKRFRSAGALEVPCETCSLNKS